MTEEWRPIHGYPDYEVSSYGRVRSWVPHPRARSKPSVPRILKPTLRHASDKYSVVNLGNQSGRKTFLVHRLVATSFLGEPTSDQPHVDHINGIREDNRIENLRWVSQRENNIAGFVRRGKRRILDCPHCGHGVAIRQPNGKPWVLVVP